MFDFSFPPPAIIEYQETQEVRFGLSIAASRYEIDQFTAPRDWRDATVEELRVYIPGDLKDMPDWALLAMFPLFVRKIGGKILFKTTVFLTSMSGSNQTWNVLADWNNSQNIVHVIGGGGSGAGTTSTSARGGGGGGAYASEQNITLTAGGNATFRLGNRATFGTGNGGAGSDCWFNGTSLSGSSVGAKGGSGATTSGSGANGGQASSSVGSTRYSGGSGGNGLVGEMYGGITMAVGGGGGGAAGPNGTGGNGTSPTDASMGGGAGGRGGNNAGGAGGGTGFSFGDGKAGTEFQVSPARGSGGGGQGAPNFITPDESLAGYPGGNYGGAGGGAGRSSTQGGSHSGGQGAQGLIVIINNHLTGI